ncbi:hypothetical protein ABPG74_005740 [Tetrahymena malaccensis]
MMSKFESISQEMKSLSKDERIKVLKQYEKEVLEDYNKPKNSLKKHDEQQKKEAVKQSLVINNNSIVVQELGISESTIRKWKQKYIEITQENEISQLIQKNVAKNLSLNFQKSYQ